MSIYEDTADSEALGNRTCPKTGYQSATVCVPVTVTPYVHLSCAKTHCCGDPVIRPGCSPCPGVLNGSCSFIFSQDVCVSIPVEFGAVASAGCPSVLCGEVSADDICTNCGDSPCGCKDCVEI